ncbi:MAG: DUF6036 family nucleotidyltransferase [Vicinamibacterales bacterium]|nr:DUF6036 family nucleotidyltransferase [Vicinamibacterales bacterium]
MSEPRLHEPWGAFLRDLDACVTGPTELHCLGGFVVASMHSFTRVTADVDVIQARGTSAQDLAKLAGRGSQLHARHKVYIDIVTVASVPEDYEARLVPLFPSTFTHLRLKALEVHDLVLAKLARNIDRDREDVRRLATDGKLDAAVLQRRYDEELRYQSGRPEREDLTLRLWIEMVQEIQGQGRP